MQTAILAPVPAHAAFLFFDVQHGVDPAEALAGLARLHPLDHRVFGLGSTLLDAVGASIDGMRPRPVLNAPGAAMPRTPSGLMIRISAADPGELLHRERTLMPALHRFTLVDRVHGFMYGESRDLTGYEDGTENPEPDEAPDIVFQKGAPGLAGSSVVAVQRWLHDLDAFEAMEKVQRDHTFGREQISNEELEDAPESAHVKRTAQEDFDPEAFVWRRSMPWRDQRGEGLVFVAFAATLDPFEALCRRMMGKDDGVVDALFSFTRPVTGASYWCPPVAHGLLDLSALGL